VAHTIAAAIDCTRMVGERFTSGVRHATRSPVEMQFVSAQLQSKFRSPIPCVSSFRDCRSYDGHWSR
jgi:hypothetical protein